MALEIRDGYRFGEAGVSGSVGPAGARRTSPTPIQTLTDPPYLRGRRLVPACSSVMAFTSHVDTPLHLHLGQCAHPRDQVR
jgi:hypothetical protein